MNTNTLEARRYIADAHEALQRGDKESAWRFDRQAIVLAPEMQDAWLVLIASEANPQQAVAYARKALQINPESTRARSGFEWALAKQMGTKTVPVEQNARLSLLAGRKDVVAVLPKHAVRRIAPTPQSQGNRSNRLYLALLVGTGCLLIGLVALFALTNPALASIVGNFSSPAPIKENLWAPADIAKPTATPIDASALALPAADTLAGAALDEAALPPMDAPTLAATEVTTVMPEATETLGTLLMEIVEENGLVQSVPPEQESIQYPAQGNGARWIDVNLAEQRVYAYERDVVVNSFLVSTGVAQTPTVTGEYRIYVKVRIQDMSGRVTICGMGLG